MKTAKSKKPTSKIELKKFPDLISQLPEKEDKIVLLGNGFGQACKADIFSYQSLLDRADFSKLSAHAKQAFGKWPRAMTLPSK